ncbi:MAG: hypothetical protein IPF63_06170 [Bacteroidetes bacterium]|nr:hypothetical protein [Bacteroidota bacterium]
MDFLPLSIADILLPIVIAALIATSLFYILGSFFSLGKVGFAIIAIIGIIANVFYFKAQFISLFGEVGVNLKFLVLFPVVFCILYLLFSLFIAYLIRNDKRPIGHHVKRSLVNFKNKKNG